jgi:hypothetical protein
MMRFLILLFLLVGQLTFAEKALNLVSPIVLEKLKSPVSVHFERQGTFLRVHFDVISKQINAKPVLGPKEYPYQYDVVEIFISVNGKTSLYPYYELEVSPYNQVFVVRVDAGKKFVNNVKINWTHNAEITASGWSVDMTIDLMKLGWQGDDSKILGNAFAITGKSPDRRFWSLYLPKMKKANFHQPQYFGPLIP